jgi:hypothetical protein
MAEFGHCNFTKAQSADGFDTLARWVATGVRPASSAGVDRAYIRKKRLARASRANPASAR